MELVSENLMRGIRASSYSSENISEIEFGSYDVLILTSSWDNRCTALTAAAIDHAKACILLLFDDKDDGGVRDKNDEILIKYAKSISECQYFIRGLSTDVDVVWGKLRAALNEILLTIGRPLSILFDLSPTPRFYSLTLLADCFKLGLAGKIDYFYNECTYPNKNDPLSDEEIAFTAGRWEAKHISNLIGASNPGLKNRFSVSIGFEGSKTLMILNGFEPDQVNVIIPCPGYSGDYVDRVRSANFELFKSFGVKVENEILSHAGDPVDVWIKAGISLVDTDKWNDYFLCAGSKPHSLGLALAAYTLQAPTLIYSLPQKHNPVTVIPKADCWLYTINYLVTPFISND